MYLKRRDLLHALADLISTTSCRHPLRVAVDGIDAAGKTTLADELVGPLAQRGRTVIRASVDGFHNLKAIRYRQGAGSPQGYYQDSFDYQALRECLIKPLGPQGSLHYRPAVFDVLADRPVLEPQRRAPRDAVLLFDGIFLMRPELDDGWDMRVFLQVGFDVAIARAVQRDSHRFSSAAATRARYQERYVPAQRHYLHQVQPHRLADVVVDNDDPERPGILRWPGGRSSPARPAQMHTDWGERDLYPQHRTARGRVAEL